MFFNYGEDASYYKSGSYYVRAVRGGQSGSGTSDDWIITGSISTEDNTALGDIPVCITSTGDPDCTAVSDSGGGYTLGDPDPLSDGIYTVTPQSDSYLFEPSSRQVRISGGSVTGVNFTAYTAGDPLPMVVYAPTDGATLSWVDPLLMDVEITGIGGITVDVVLRDAAGKPRTLRRFFFHEDGRQTASQQLPNLTAGDYEIVFSGNYRDENGVRRAEETRTLHIEEADDDVRPQPDVRVELINEFTDAEIPQVRASEPVGFDVYYEYPEYLATADDVQVTATQTLNGVVTALTPLSSEGDNESGSVRFGVAADDVAAVRTFSWEVIPPAGNGYRIRSGSFQVETAHGIDFRVHPSHTVDGEAHDFWGKPVIAGQEVVLRLEVKDENGQLIPDGANAQIKTTLKYEQVTGAEYVAGAGIMATPEIVFHPKEDEPGVLTARYVPLTPGLLKHRFTYEVRLPGYIQILGPDTTYVDYFDVQSDASIHSRLQAFNADTARQMDEFDLMGADLAAAGKFFVERRDEKERQMYMDLIGAILSGVKVLGGDKIKDVALTPSDFCKKVFHLDSLKSFQTAGETLELMETVLRNGNSYQLDAALLAVLGPLHFVDNEISDYVDTTVLGIILDNLLWEPEPFLAPTGIKSIWNNYFWNVESKMVWKGAKSLASFPADMDQALVDELTSRLTAYWLANEVIVAETKAGMSKVISTKEYMEEADNAWNRKVVTFLMKDGLPLLLNFTPAGPTGSAAYSAVYSSISAGVSKYQSVLAKHLAELAYTDFQYGLYDGPATVAQNHAAVYDTLIALKEMSVSDLPPVPQGELEILGEFAEGESTWRWKNVQRQFIRVRLTNTGTTDATFFVTMLYDAVFQKLWGTQTQKFSESFFRDESGEYAKQIDLAAGSSRILEFDLSRSNFRDMPDIDMVPVEKHYIPTPLVPVTITTTFPITFKAMAIPAYDTTTTPGLMLVDLKVLDFQNDFEFEEITSTRSADYRTSTLLVSRTTRSDTQIEMRAPLSIQAFTSPGEDRVNVVYTFRNDFDDPVYFELDQPLPDGMSVETKDGYLSETGIFFSLTVEPGERNMLFFQTQVSGADDFTLPTATLTFLHPLTGETLEMAISMSARDMADLVPMSFDFSSPSLWPIGSTVSNTLTVHSDYEETKEISIDLTVDNSDGENLIHTTVQKDAVSGDSDLTVETSLATDLTAQDALLTVTVTWEDGPEITVVEDQAIRLIYDNDADGLPDDWETENGLDTSTDDTAADKDDDGLTNAEEYENGTKANVADTDGDGLKDGQEVSTYHTDPLLSDTDGGGQSDGAEVSAGKSPTSNQDDALDLVIHLPSDVTLGDYFLITWTPSNPFAANVTYRVSVGTSSGGSNVISWTDTGEQTTYALDTTRLPENQTCYVNVQLLQNGVTKATRNRNLTAYRSHLADAIQCLQVVAGIPSATGTYSVSDISGDDRIGLEEAIDSLQRAAGGK